MQEEYLRANGEKVPTRSANSKSTDTTFPLLPAAEIQGLMPPGPASNDDLLSQAMEIQRPRSALHAGDFDEKRPGKQTEEIADAESRLPLQIRTESSQTSGPLGRSPTTPWYEPPPSFTDRTFEHTGFRDRDAYPHEGFGPSRSRAPSIGSFTSSSYVLKAPTTPLVQAVTNADFDFLSRDRSLSPGKNNRRHTLPPHALSSLYDPASPPDIRYQLTPSRTWQRDHRAALGHNYRRSLASTGSIQQTATSPNSAFSRSRRTSFSSEASPLQHATMVGSYEESILRGRMSTAPSKPLDFTAQIGVLGKGNCKPKCPPHITVPFPAVYYNWSVGIGRQPTTDEPSPYVGQIDLQESSALAPHRTRDRDAASEEHDGQVHLPETESCLPSAQQNALPKHRKRRRTSPSRSPPDGSYRIPEQGQLQIIIKNPNKTAVKLFLVPYDLGGMEPGTKTFIRQRLLSAGPIIDSPLGSKLAARRSSLFDTNQKHTLRYLIHLNICCPARGRFYLYQHIRVVFANRVPDNKEQLRTETQIPEPRFSPWKPHSLSRQTSGAGARFTAEKAFRRRSSGFGFGEDIKAPWSTDGFSSGAPFSFHGDGAPPVPPIPFHLPSRNRSEADHSGGGILDDAMDVDSSRPTTASDLQSPENGKRTCRGCVPLSESLRRDSSSGLGEYEKLNRGDVGYGGLYGRPSTPEPGAGLLARRLKGLGVEPGLIADPELERTAGPPFSLGG